MEHELLHNRLAVDVKRLVNNLFLLIYGVSSVVYNSKSTHLESLVEERGTV